jgi:hypothetical protein
VITRLEALSYRCFRQLSIDLKPYQVIAGANGAGKTTFLDLVPLLGDMARARQISDAFLLEQGSRLTRRASSLVELVHNYDGTDIAFAVEAELPVEVVNQLAVATSTTTRPLHSHLRYELRLRVLNGVELRVLEEYLFLYAPNRAPAPGVLQGDGRNRDRHWQFVIDRAGGEATDFSRETASRRARPIQLRIPPHQLALGATPADREQFPAALWFADLLDVEAVFYEPDWTLLRQAARPGLSRRLIPSGENTPWLALDLQRRDPARFELWVDHVRTALPNVASIEAIEREEDRSAYFAVTYAGNHRVTSSGLSDGTVRILAYCLLPYLDDLPRLLVTEEPENGIHPKAIETAMTSLSSLDGTQVLVSTHSPVVLAGSQLSDLLVARIEDGVATIQPGHEHPQLRDWKAATDLGTLFAAGVLG